MGRKADLTCTGQSLISTVAYQPGRDSRGVSGRLSRTAGALAASRNAKPLELRSSALPARSGVYTDLFTHPAASIPRQSQYRVFRLKKARYFWPLKLKVIMMMSTGMLGEDGIHVDMDHLKKGEVNLGTSMFVLHRTAACIL
ncbi:hypothetical protein IQ07DRAFT_353066 [Pyrenochaeta sp. DS3sAY3a]|nr:hypothetical protein IQ07DRAFT_353066 [Pyrenochaeta sp. DS3sAY3a]